MSRVDAVTFMVGVMVAAALMFIAANRGNVALTIAWGVMVLGWLFMAAHWSDRGRRR